MTLCKVFHTYVTLPSLHLSTSQVKDNLFCSKTRLEVSNFKEKVDIWYFLANNQNIQIIKFNSTLGKKRNC